MALYVLDENNNKIEVTTEVLTAIVQQVVCCESGTPHSMAFVTQAKYNQLETTNALVTNCVYFITDDTTAYDINKQLADLTINLNKIIDGTQAIQSAANITASIRGVALTNIFEANVNQFSGQIIELYPKVKEATKANLLNPTKATTTMAANGSINVYIDPGSVYVIKVANTTFILQTSDEPASGYVLDYSTKGLIYINGVYREVYLEGTRNVGTGYLTIRLKKLNSSGLIENLTETTNLAVSWYKVI